jgi:hypothetical protein
MSSPASTPSAPNTLTSFSQLFGRTIEGLIINEIEIPIIQRDYAQGRKTAKVNRIRENFIDTLCKALLPNAVTEELDFVFGDVELKEGESQGKFWPLDGQQRLTTLFLLHCYLAWRVGVRPQDQPWKEFSYATRPGAREFCGFLVECQPEFSDTLSAWIKDHADYLPTWQHDPTIQSMLVVLDAMHEWFSRHSPNLQAAWAKLVDEEQPAIRFHVLPIKENGLTDELYIKMNSRGKPLTTFENFKAHFEDMLKTVHPHKVNHFSIEVDTSWSEILWTYRGDDHLIDEEFMRYFRFVTEVCAWKTGVSFDDDSRNDDLAELVYGLDAKCKDENLNFLLKAFDVWKGKNVKGELEGMMTGQSGDGSIPLLMFHPFEMEGVDLLHACCRHYGTPRKWTLADTLLLYGVLLRYIHDVEEASFSKRLRILRNLVEASEDEIRAGKRDNMPKLLVDVEQIIVNGNLQQVGTFNQVQVRNELAKATMLEANANLAIELYRLEDHDLLRGGLTAFDLDPDLFAQRAQAFNKIFDKSFNGGDQPWKPLTGALLALGNYSRQGKRFTGHRLADFGAPANDDPWRELFRGRKDEPTHPISAPLMAFLDAVSANRTLLDAINAYLNDPQTLKDWRYYFVKYDVMREGASGRYTISPNGGYQVCMLNRSIMASRYYDPYLLAIVQQSQIDTDRIANLGWPCCYTGYENEPRTLILKNSSLQIQCVDEGWQISEIPIDQGQKAAFDLICTDFNIRDDFLYPAPQSNDGIDTADRVERGGKLLARLIKDGF